MTTSATRGMQEAAIVVVQQRDAMESAILAYGVAVPELAEKIRAAAYAALDAILDAQREKHVHLANVLRGR